MAKQLGSFTGPSTPYPATISMALDGDEVVVTARGDGTRLTGARVCGQTCRPGTSVCNNYCAHDAQAPVPATPPDYAIDRAGPTVSLRLPAADFRTLLGDAVGNLG